MFTNTYTLKEYIQESALHFGKTKAFGKKTREYYNGDQLDETIKLILANRGQPQQYENQIAKHFNSILGHKKDRNIEIKLFGRQQKDKSAANMLNALLKALTATSDYEDEVDSLDDELGLEGVAIAELTVKASGEFDRFGREHKDEEVNAVPSREMFLDPFANPKDYANTARYTHRAFWIDVEDLYALGFDEENIKNLSTHNYLAHSVDDDLHNDENVRKRVLLTYSWYRQWHKQDKKDKFYYSFWSNDTILLDGESPYDFKGIPYEVEFLESDFTGEIKYWGLFRHIMPLQDNINYAKLRLQNMLGNQKTYFNRTAIIEENGVQFASENSMDNANIMVEDINGIKDVKQHAQIQQILNTIIDNRNQISELLNSNKELLGNANNRMSEVGQQRRIKSGLIGLSRFTNKSDKLQKKIIKKRVALIGQYYDTERVVSIIDEDYMQDYLVINQVVENEIGGIDFEQLKDGSVKPVETNKVKIGKYDLIYLPKEKDDTISDERLRLNAELMRTARETNPEYLDFLFPLMLNDMQSPDAKKLKNFIEQQKEQGSNSPEAQELARIKGQMAQLEASYKVSQTNLNNSKAKSMNDKNKIDLQKAFSSATIAQENIKTKQQANMTNALRSIG
jgi:hypothetical protein